MRSTGTLLAQQIAKESRLMKRIARRRMLVRASALCGILLMPSPLLGQRAEPAPAPANLLRNLSASLESLTRRVSGSVVQVLVMGYGPVDQRSRDGETGLVIGRQRSIGSGAIVDADGYIVTNAHVVEGARRVQVVLPRELPETGPLQSLGDNASLTVDAKIAGVSSELDLALLKIEVKGLHAIRFADYDALRQGELVFAFGSPEGLRNSITMGVVSSVARQPDPDSPVVYIQTDAPINPGNSGGPLVNVGGELVGLNTMILTDSGGSQGLGFAIPSAVVASACAQLKKYGHLHRGLVGFSPQTITPALAAGLGLSRNSGVIVSDVTPGGAAEAAGLKIMDVIAAVNGRPVDTVPLLSLELSRYAGGDVVALDVIRGRQPVKVTLTVEERPHALDALAGMANPESSAVGKLGILGIDVGAEMASLIGDLRIPSGVLVAARTQPGSGNDVPLVPGDLVHAVNGVSVRSVDALRVLVDDAKADSPLILQIERNGQLLFVTCRIY
jgi:serine protease Do